MFYEFSVLYVALYKGVCQQTNIQTTGPNKHKHNQTMHYVISVTQCKHTHTHLRTLEYRHKTFFYQIDILLNNKRQCDTCDGKINYVAPTI